MSRGIWRRSGWTFWWGFLALGERARIWALYGDGLRPMQRGLERSFERARNGRASAVNRPEVAAIHDGRKWIKYHWDHTGLLRPMERGPPGLKAGSCPNF